MIASELNKIDRLKNYLNTDIKKKVFFHYFLEASYPKRISDEENINIQTADKITKDLEKMDFLKAVEPTETQEGRGKVKRLYTVNWEFWVRESLKPFESLFKLREDEFKELVSIIKDKFLIAFFFALFNRKNFLEFVEKIFSNNEAKMLYSGIARSIDPPYAKYPTILLFILTLSPLFNSLKSEDKLKLDEILDLLNNWLESDPYFKKHVDSFKADTLAYIFDKLGKARGIIKTAIERTNQEL